MLCVAKYFLMAAYSFALGPHRCSILCTYWLYAMKRISSAMRHSGLKLAGGMIRQMPNRDATGAIRSMYSSGSWNSFSLGRNTGASTIWAGSSRLGNAVLLSAWGRFAGGSCCLTVDVVAIALPVVGLDRCEDDSDELELIRERPPGRGTGSTLLRPSERCSTGAAEAPPSVALKRG
uniref:Putative secreted protein n=1 Tax=Anopheles darlingi TaxID=43151 RepID=A0A2M4D5I7_ANODA